MVNANTPQITIHLNNIQGNILGGFNKDYQAFLFLQFTDAAEGRAWIKDIVPKIATSAEVIAFNNLFRAVKAQRGKELGILKATWTNLAFTSSGLLALGLPNTELSSFPVAFRQGMRARATILGDVGDSAPDMWVEPLRSQDVHALLIVASDTQADLHQQVARYQQDIDTNGTIRVLFLQEGEVRQDQPGHEHFGFKDSVSQPGIRGVDSASEKDPNQGRPGQDLLWPGEFVLGYATQIPTPKPGTDELNRDPGPISQSGPQWTVDGSYLVFRRLRQDVKGFREFIAAQAAVQQLSPEVMGAKLVGRYASGAPLALREEMKKALTVDPNDSDPSRARPELLDDFHNNDFEYSDDPNGIFVPRAAHIRKVYPRDQKIPGESNTQTHRLLRRGIPFGKSWGAPIHGDSDEVFPFDRGLLFLCYQADIEKQFEFVQRMWVNNPNFPESQDGGDGHDPIISQQETLRTFRLPKKTGQIAHLQLMKHWVTTTGGEYFFQPSIEALSHIASLGGNKVMRLPEIKISSFCDEVSSDPAVYRVTPEQILEVLGGLANLYLGKLISRGLKECKVATESAFASDLVTVPEIRQEIANCSGATDGRVDAIFRGMQKTLQNAFERQEKSAQGSVLLFEPLGTFEVIELRESRYFLTYRDPAAEDYAKFLFNERDPHADQHD
jgi:Dyp-type peroxidase family